jgi:hypothetical protein
MAATVPKFGFSSLHIECNNDDDDCAESGHIKKALRSLKWYMRGDETAMLTLQQSSALAAVHEKVQLVAAALKAGTQEAYQKASDYPVNTWSNEEALSTLPDITSDLGAQDEDKDVLLIMKQTGRGWYTEDAEWIIVRGVLAGVDSVAGTARIKPGFITCQCEDYGGGVAPSHKQLYNGRLKQHNGDWHMYAIREDMLKYETFNALVFCILDSTKL